MDKAVKIIYFDTYIDAAIDAYLHRLILLSGLRYTTAFTRSRVIFNFWLNFFVW